jgi:cytochrome c-type biogenesis protein CcmF
VFLGAVIGGSLCCLPGARRSVGLGGRFSLFSRESLLLLNNVLLAAAAAVLLGTLYPLFLDALDLGKISVGPPYFESVFVPLMLPVLLLLAVGAVCARWKWRARCGRVAGPLRLAHRRRLSLLFGWRPGCAVVHACRPWPAA